MKKKNWIKFLFIGILFILAITIFTTKKNDNIRIIGVIEPFQHIAMDDISKGIQDGIGESSKEFKIITKNANKDQYQLAQIVSYYIDNKIDIYVPIFTNTTQTVKSLVKDKPIVFSAVTDPQNTGIIQNIKQPEGNITGVSDLWPISDNLKLISKIVPNKKRIGVVFDPGDPSSSVTIYLLEEECRKQDFLLVKRPITNSSEINHALYSLIGKIDILFTANDVTITTAFPALVAFCIENNIPLFAGDYSSVKRGAIGAIGQNYYMVGLDTGKIVRKILNGSNISDLPVVYTTGGDIYLNTYTAKLMKVSIPDNILNEAKEKYDRISE